MEWLYGALAELGIRRLWAWCRDVRRLLRKVQELETENKALKTALGQSPEIRLNNTTTYREQPDGSRIVTQTTLAKPARIRADVSAKPSVETNVSVVDPDDQS